MNLRPKANDGEFAIYKGASEGFCRLRRDWHSMYAECPLVLYHYAIVIRALVL